MTLYHQKFFLGVEGLCSVYAYIRSHSPLQFRINVSTRIGSRETESILFVLGGDSKSDVVRQNDDVSLTDYEESAVPSGYPLRRHVRTTLPSHPLPTRPCEGWVSTRPRSSFKF